MVDVTIDQLLDGEATRDRTAVGPFNQGGVTFKGSVPPNPPREIHAINQAQLEAELGPGLNIPDGESLKIVIDEAFTLTTGFKIGTGSSLEFTASTPNTVINFTPVGMPMFANTVIANDIFNVTISDITIIGNSVNSIFDVKGTGIVIMRDVNFVGFGDLGTIQVTFSNFRTCAFQNMTRGLKFVGISAVGITQCTIVQSIAQNATFFSFVAGVGPLIVDVDTVRVFSAFAGDSLLFLDPNATPGSVFAVEKSGSGGGDFYQPGITVGVDSVADASGAAEFTTGLIHNLVVGRPVVLSGFTEPSYNGTFIVSAVDTPLVGTTFQCEGVAFNINDTGFANPQSLDSTNVKIIAESNQGVPNSMFTGDAGLEIFGAEISSSSLAQDAFEVITSASWAYNNLERFAIGVSNQGQMVAEDMELRRYTINYSATIEKSGGGSTNIGIVLLKNGVEIGFNAPHTVNTGKIQIGTGDIVELTVSDTVQVAVINYDSTAATILISQVSLVINRA